VKITYHCPPERITVSGSKPKKPVYWRAELWATRPDGHKHVVKIPRTDSPMTFDRMKAMMDDAVTALVASEIDGQPFGREAVEIGYWVECR